MPLPQLRALVLTALVATFTALPALAQDDIRQVQVQFPAGSTGTTLKDRITGRESISYLLGAEAGQVMDLRLTSASPSVYFNLYEPGKGPGDEALATGELTPDLNHFTGPLPVSGTYTVSVYLYRNAARDGKSAEFTLDVSVTGATGEVVQGDFADGLAGGPDYWEVRTTGGGTLNLRAAPSAGAAVVTRLAGGTPLRNLGCRMAEGRRWCRVATLADPGVEGWAAGDFLVEGAGPGATTPKARPAASAATPEEACRAAIAAQVEPGYAVVVTGSEFSQAGTMVRLSVGPCNVPWQCIAYADGSTDGGMFMGNDGDGVCDAAAGGTATQLPADTPTPEEQACLAAVSRETNNGDVMVMGSDFSQAGTMVQVGVGPDRAPWQCIAYADGSTGGIEYLGQDGGSAPVAPMDDNPTALAEGACLAAVSATTANPEVQVLSSEFSEAGTLVMIGVGPDRAPWKCIGYSDGSTGGIEFQGEG